jgi:hypothetical protein
MFVSVQRIYKRNSRLPVCTKFFGVHPTKKLIYIYIYIYIHVYLLEPNRHSDKSKVRPIYIWMHMQLLWDYHLPHGSAPNNSNRCRMAQFLKVARKDIFTPKVIDIPDVILYSHHGNSLQWCMWIQSCTSTCSDWFHWKTCMVRVTDIRCLKAPAYKCLHIFVCMYIFVYVCTIVYLCIYVCLCCIKCVFVCLYV